MDGEDRNDGGAVEQINEAQSEAPARTELEDTAYELGWRPEAEYRGPEGSWKPARDYIKTRSGRAADKRQIDRLQDQIERMASTSGKLMERALNEQAAEIEGRFKTAVKDGDEAGAAKAVRDMDKLKDDAREQGGTRRDYDNDFATDNPWYGKHKAATLWAQGRSAELGADKVPFDRQLEIIAEEARTEFPQFFDKKSDSERKGPLSVAAPSRGGDRSQSQDFGSLPGDVKRTCDSMAEAAYTRFGRGADKTKYMADYRTRYAKTYYSEKAA